MRDIANYVVSVKRIVDHLGNPIKEEDQYYEYMSYDKYAGSMSTGYPCWGYLRRSDDI